MSIDIPSTDMARTVDPVVRGRDMDYSHDGYTASIQHNWENEKEFWIYTIRRAASGEMLYQGFTRTALEAVETVEQRIKALGIRKSA